MDKLKGIYVPSSRIRPGVYSSGLNIIKYSNTTAEHSEQKSVNFIEYIESTGTQFIDTGYTPNTRTMWKVDMQAVERNTFMLCGNGEIKMNKARLYGSTIEEDGILILDLKPCKDADGVCCLYDTVTEKYFYNQGTGEFVSP